MAQDKIKMHESLSATVGENESLEQIKENFLKVKSVLAAHQIALWEINIVTLECTFTEEYFASLGLDKVGIHFRNLEEFFNFVHPDDKHLVSFDGFQQKLEGFEEATLLRIRCVGAHGEIVWLEDRLLSVETDGDGKPERLLCYTVNVTEQCEREAHILRIEERNRKIIEALPEFIFILDDNFFITDVLMSSDTVLLHPVNQLKGADGRSIYSPEVSDLFLRNIHQCLEDGQLKEIEYPLDVDNCERHYFQARISPFEGNKVMALIHDIGDRVQRSNELIEAKQRAEEADRMKSVFLANMSHEIRTPLNAIVGFSKLISSTNNENEKNQYAEIIERNSDMLLNLFNDILDLSSLEADSLKFNIQPVKILDICLQLEQQYGHKTQADVKLILDGGDANTFVSADWNRTIQIVSNLLSNAVKFTSRGEIHFGFLNKENFVEFYVRDTGIGIPAERAATIFQRFGKVDDFVQGTGLGLTLCKMLVEKMGGHIRVCSKENEGTTFYFTLPLANR